MIRTLCYVPSNYELRHVNTIQFVTSSKNTPGRESDYPKKKKQHAKNCQSYFDCTGPGTHLLVIYVVTSLSHSIHGTGTNAYTVGELFHGKCWVDIWYVTLPQMDPEVWFLWFSAKLTFSISFPWRSRQRVASFVSFPPWEKKLWPIAIVLLRFRARCNKQKKQENI